MGLLCAGPEDPDDALEIRRRVLLAYERAERETDAARRAPWLTFVVIGAGATGVEMAGTLAEIARQTLRDEFRRFDACDAKVILLEAGERVLFLRAANRSATLDPHDSTNHVPAM